MQRQPEEESRVSMLECEGLTAGHCDSRGRGLGPTPVSVKGSVCLKDCVSWP